VKMNAEPTNIQRRSPLTTRAARSDTLGVTLSLSTTLSTQWTSAMSVLKHTVSRSKVFDLSLQLPSAISSGLSMGLRAAERVSESFRYLPSRVSHGISIYCSV
jgi:hypothetical protein